MVTEEVRVRPRDSAVNRRPIAAKLVDIQVEREEEMEVAAEQKHKHGAPRDEDTSNGAQLPALERHRDRDEPFGSQQDQGPRRQLYKIKLLSTPEVLLTSEILAVPCFL